LKKNTIVSIIGAGPAGLSASIQLSRFGIEHFIFDRSVPGGLLRNGNLVSNYTGVFPPVTGEVLAGMMIDHFNSYSREVIRSIVERVDYSEATDKFSIKAGSSDYISDFVIAASGTIPVKPDIIKSVSSDLLKYIDFGVTGLTGVEAKRILVVGGGDSAFDYALTLSTSNNIVIFNRSERIRALKSLKEVVFSIKNIRYRKNTELIGIENGSKRSLSVNLLNSGVNRSEEFDRIVFATGRKPEDTYLSDLGKSVLGSLIRRGRIYISGDMNKGRCRQALIAAGDGLESAMKINDLIEGYHDESSI